MSTTSVRPPRAVLTDAVRRRPPSPAGGHRPVRARAADQCRRRGLHPAAGAAQGRIPDDLGPVPEADEPDLVARVAVAQQAAPTVSCEALAAAVPHRHTNRWPFAGAAVPAEHLDHLVDAARREGARLYVPAKAGRDAVLGLSQDAQRMLRDRPGYPAELARWAAARCSSRRATFEPEPALLVLATRGDQWLDWVLAGQALQRVLLTATW